MGCTFGTHSMTAIQETENDDMKELSPDTKEAILQKLKNEPRLNTLFVHFSHQELLDFVDKITLQVFDNKYLCQKGENSEFLFFVVKGEIICLNSSGAPVKTFRTHQCIGVESFCSDKPYSESYMSPKKAFVAVISRTIFEEATETIPVMMEKLTILSKVETKSQLAKFCEIKKYKPRNLILKKGTVSDKLYIVFKGTVRRDDDGVLVDVQGYFGDDTALDLLVSPRVKSSMRATTNVTILMIKQEGLSHPMFAPVREEILNDMHEADRLRVVGLVNGEADVENLDRLFHAQKKFVYLDEEEQKEKKKNAGNLPELSTQFQGELVALEAQFPIIDSIDDLSNPMFPDLLNTFLKPMSTAFFDISPIDLFGDYWGSSVVTTTETATSTNTSDDNLIAQATPATPSREKKKRKSKKSKKRKKDGRRSSAQSEIDVAGGRLSSVENADFPSAARERRFMTENPEIKSTRLGRRSSLDSTNSAAPSAVSVSVTSVAQDSSPTAANAVSDPLAIGNSSRKGGTPPSQQRRISAQKGRL